MDQEINSTDTANALRRTADWLEANPDRHIATVLAVNLDGKDVNPTASDAYCFCALGRFTVEAGIELPSQHDYRPIKQALEIEDTSEVTDLNDFGVRLETLSLPSGIVVDRGNPRVIPYLRKLADQIEAGA